jgi:hypothetical protein
MMRICTGEGREGDRPQVTVSRMRRFIPPFREEWQ